MEQIIILGAILLLFAISAIVRKKFPETEKNDRYNLIISVIAIILFSIMFVEHMVKAQQQSDIIIPTLLYIAIVFALGQRALKNYRLLRKVN